MAGGENRHNDARSAIAGKNEILISYQMRRTRIILLIFIIVGILSPKDLLSQDKLGLLIIAHGSPVPQWNASVLSLEEEVKKMFFERSNNPFSQIRVAFMQFGEPSISRVIRDLENAAVDKAYAIPLFIAPSGHSLYDIPTILGLYSDKEMIKAIKEEGMDIVNSKMKITMGSSLDKRSVLKEVMLDRVKELSSVPDSEGVVLLAHGDTRFEPIWDSMCREIGSHVCARTGIRYFDYAFVEIGQSFISEGAPAILKTADKCKKTIVVGLDLSIGAEDVALNSILHIGGIKMESKEMFAGKNIHFSKRGLLPDRRISEWIVDRALEWVESLQ